jgi:hypothetical protein
MVQRKASIPCAPLDMIGGHYGSTHGGHYGSTHMDELGQKLKVVFVYAATQSSLAITTFVPIFCLKLHYYP